MVVGMFPSKGEHQKHGCRAGGRSRKAGRVDRAEGPTDSARSTQSLNLPGGLLGGGCARSLEAAARSRVKEGARSNTQTGDPGRAAVRGGSLRRAIPFGGMIGFNPRGSQRNVVPEGGALTRNQRSQIDKNTPFGRVNCKFHRPTKLHPPHGYSRPSRWSKPTKPLDMIRGEPRTAGS